MHFSTSGIDQAIIIRDITIQVGDTVFGGSNEDSLLYESIFGGLQYNEGTNTYNLPTGAQSWAGSALPVVVDGATQPGFLDGTLLNEPITITFLQHSQKSHLTLLQHIKEKMHLVMMVL